MKKIIKISVIIPFYNAEKYFKKCLNSILNQTLNEIEILCINDGSVDNSINILQKFSLTDKRIKIVTQKNKGPASARNLGIYLSRGEYLAFMDADDYYPANNVLEKLYREANKTNAIICGGNLEIDVNHNVIETAGYGHLKKNSYINFREYQNDYGFYRFIYKTSFIKENKLKFPNYKYYEDPPFLLSAMIRATKFYAIKDNTYCYRLNNIEDNNWDDNKVNDLAKGLLFCISTANENKLYKNISNHINAINNDYKIIIEKHLLNRNEKLFSIMQAIYRQTQEKGYRRSVYYTKIDENISYLLTKNDISNFYAKNKKIKITVKKYKKRKLIINIAKCIRDNGIKYTFERILFHLHIAKDNDILRTYTKNKKD